MKGEKRRCLVFSLVAAMFVLLFMSMNFTVYADGGCNISSFQSFNGTIDPVLSENIVCNDTMYREELLSVSENYTLDDLTAIADGSDISEQVKNSLVTNGYVLIDVSSYSSLSITYYWTGSGDCIIVNGSGIWEPMPHIKVFDEYLIDADTTDKVTRVDAEANDYNLDFVWSYNPKSNKTGYQYNGNLSVIAFDGDGNSVDVNANFESIDASTGAVSFIPMGFKEIYITYQYSDGSVPPRPIAGYYNLTVKDHFGLQMSIREKKVVPDGTPYNYDALSKEGWVVVGSTNLNGVVIEDTVLDFYYEKESTPETETDLPAVGTTVTSGKESYKVTKEGTDVAFTKTADKSASVTIPATVKIDNVTYKVTSVASNAFKNNKKLTKVTVGKNVASIGSAAFSGCTKLTTVTLGKNVASIGNGAFKNCTSLKKVTVPDKVASIGDTAFYGCKKLTSVTIGKGVKKIGKETFKGCSKLASITIKSIALKSVGKNAFKGIKSNAKIKVPAKKLTAYKKLLKGKGQGSKVKITR